jgi:hypothetical protein
LGIQHFILNYHQEGEQQEKHCFAVVTSNYEKTLGVNFASWTRKAALSLLLFAS